MLAVFPQASGIAGVRQTLRKMVQLANGAMLDPLIRDQAAVAVSGCGKGNRSCWCAALMLWVNRKVQYVPDPSGVELLHDPRLMARGLATGKRVYGDCDDMSTYLAALLKSIGLAPIFRAVGYDGKPFQHVYVCCQGMRLDATLDSWQVSGSHEETSVLEERV